MKTHDQEQPTEMPEACTTTPMGRAIRLIGDAWILLIIITLLRGPKRFNELRELTQRLRVLEEMGFVQHLRKKTLAQHNKNGRRYLKGEFDCVPSRMAVIQDAL
jgi:DNA-binding HxlR family transcriptional regulator